MQDDLDDESGRSARKWSWPEKGIRSMKNLDNVSLANTELYLKYSSYKVVATPQFQLQNLFCNMQSAKVWTKEKTFQVDVNIFCHLFQSPI